ncbi:hypothetical protein PINS_up011253 [Pythium insidiosum]|nr:hypothetical protein PINS_up011253 [Pythium insidiosum]
MHSRTTGAPVLSRRSSPSPTPTLSRRSSTRQSDESDDSDEEEHLVYAHVRRGSSSYHLLKLQHQSSSKQLDAAGVASSPASSTATGSSAANTTAANANANAATYTQGSASRRSSLATGAPPSVGPTPASFNPDRRGSVTAGISDSRRSSLVTAATPRGSGAGPQLIQERRGSSSSRRSSLVAAGNGSASGNGNGTPATEPSHGPASRRASLALDSVSEQGPAVSSTALPLPSLAAKVDAAVKRPHFLKERSVTMVDRIPVQSSGDVHSRAGAFLLSLVERSRHTGSVFDTKRAAFESSRTPSAASDDSSLLLATGAVRSNGGPPAQSPSLSRRRSVSSTPSTESLVRPSDSRPTSGALSNRRAGLASARSLGLLLGATASGSTANDDDDDDDDQELCAPPSIVELGRELALHNRSCAAQVALLQELMRRLQDAEDDGDGAHAEHCRALVDDGLLPTVVAAMREFRFHAGLQLAAIALLSYVAEVSELYALLMSDLDLEPLVQKVVAVHVSRERLVMMGSALHHALMEARSNARARQMRKAFDAERERKRAASLACVLSTSCCNNSNSACHGRAAEQHRSSAGNSTNGKERGPRHRGAGVGSVDRSAGEELHVRRPTLRLRRAELGTPPVLDAHYQLDTSARCTAIPPLRPQSTPALASPELWVEDGVLRPGTSPAELLLWRHPSDPSPLSVARNEATAAAYAPSPLLTQQQQQQHWKRHGKTKKRVGRSSQRRQRLQRNEDERHERNNEVESASFQQQQQQQERENDGADSGEKKNGEQGEREQVPEDQEEEEEEEEEYEEDFAADDDDASVASSRVMLTPAGSDGELLDLVLQSEQEIAAPSSSAEPTARKPLLPMDSDGELIDILQLQLEAERRSDQDSLAPAPAPPSITAPAPPAQASESTEELALMEPTVLALETANAEPPQRDKHTTEIVELLASCTLSPMLSSTSASSNSLAPPSTPQSTRMRRCKRVAPSSSLTTDAAPALWVRPVNKRVIEKTTPTGGRVISATDAAEITSILRQIDDEPTVLEPLALPLPQTATEPPQEEPVACPSKPLQSLEPLESQPQSQPQPSLSSPQSQPQSPSRRAQHKRPQQRTGVLSDIQELYKRGLELHKANDLEPAIRCYQQAIRLQTSLPVGREFASLYINLGSAWMTQRRYTDALGAFQHAERIQPENCKAVFNTALALLMLGRQQEACKRFRRVLELDPTHGRARCALHAIDPS